MLITKTKETLNTTSLTIGTSRAQTKKAPLVDIVVLISVTFLTNSTLLETKSTPNENFNRVVREAVSREVKGGDVEALGNEGLGGGFCRGVFGP